jgi:hypothetical protein
VAHLHFCSGLMGSCWVCKQCVVTVKAQSVSSVGTVCMCASELAEDHCTAQLRNRQPLLIRRQYSSNFYPKTNDYTRGVLRLALWAQR